MIWISHDSVSNLKSILSEQSKEEKIVLRENCDFEVGARHWMTSPILGRKPANHRSCTIISPIKSRLSRPHAWSLIDSFPPWLDLGQHSFGLKVRLERREKKFAIESRGNLKVRGLFPLRLCWWVCCWREKMNVVPSRRFSCSSLLYSSCRFRCWNIEIFRNIRHQALADYVSFSYRAEYILNQSVILIEATFNRAKVPFWGWKRHATRNYLLDSDACWNFAWSFVKFTCTFISHGDKQLRQTLNEWI